jgi:uncharacterized protein YhfF
MSAVSVPERYRDVKRFSFGDGPEMADELLALVLAGTKIATCSLYDPSARSHPGDRWIACDGSGQPACVIEIVEVTVRRYNEVDAAFASDEGEGDRTLEFWRAAHREYFEQHSVFADDMMLECERFRVVEVFPR